MKYIFLFITLLFLLFKPILVEARNGNQGCCSHHGGVSGCSGGSIVCGDGSYSPSCGCSSPSYVATPKPMVTYKPIATLTPTVVPYVAPIVPVSTKTDDGWGTIATLGVLGGLGYWGYRSGKNKK